MSSYGEERDRREEVWNQGFEAQQKGFERAQYYEGGKKYTSKQEAKICCSFMAIVLLILTILIVWTVTSF